MIEDIFDLTSVSDRSEQFVQQLKPTINIRKDSMNILNLFERKSVLSIDEILIGYARLYNVEKKRAWVTSNMYNLCKKKMIIKVEGTKDKYQRIS